jgi:hypothetical protein
MISQQRQAHLSLLESLVRRMAAGSLMLKAWATLLVGALVAVAAQPHYRRWAWLALALTIAFWLLDAHLLRQRRLYHRAYERARLVSEPRVDFTLDTSAVDSDSEAFSELMFSKMPGLFYAALAALTVLARLLWR